MQYNSSQVHTNRDHEGDFSIAQDILSRIEEERVKPISRWYFIFKNDAFWGLGLLCILIGSISIAVLLYAVSSAEFSYYYATHDSLLEFLYDALPVIWILLFAVFIIAGLVQIRATSRGYTYSLVVVIGGSLVLSVIGGTVLHYYGFGEAVERAIGPRIPFHQPIYLEKQVMWQNPERGIIAGTIIATSSIDRRSPSGIGKNDPGSHIDTQSLRSFTIQDFSGNSWTVYSDTIDAKMYEMFENGQSVRIVGYIPADMDMADMYAGIATGTAKEPTKTLYACLVLPWNSISLDYVVSTGTTTEAVNQPARETDMQIGRTESERNSLVDRISNCKAIKPYQLLQQLRAVAQ